MFRPDSVNIFGNIYPIKYCDTQIDVDINRKQEFYGQIDYPSQSIRVFDNGSLGDAEILSTILEEVIHGITESLGFDCFESKKDTRNCGGYPPVYQMC